MPRLIVSLKNSTSVTEPSESDAVAASAMVAGAVKAAPGAGFVNVTVGATFGAVIVTVVVYGADASSPS